MQLVMHTLNLLDYFLHVPLLSIHVPIIITNAYVSSAS